MTGDNVAVNATSRYSIGWRSDSSLVLSSQASSRRHVSQSSSLEGLGVLAYHHSKAREGNAQYDVVDHWPKLYDKGCWRSLHHLFEWQRHLSRPTSNNICLRYSFFIIWISMFDLADWPWLLSCIVSCHILIIMSI